MRYNRQGQLAHLILESIRYALEQPSHPDSKRQRKARQEARELRQARSIKARRIAWLPRLPVVWEPPPRPWDY